MDDILSKRRLRWLVVLLAIHLYHMPKPPGCLILRVGEGKAEKGREGRAGKEGKGSEERRGPGGKGRDRQQNCKYGSYSMVTEPFLF